MLPIFARNLYLFGEGELWITFEKLKKKLELEGLFDISLKKSIPSYPQKIGIITSAEGAALQDIINVIERRATYIKCYIYPVPVQGHTAPKKIAAASGMDAIAQALESLLSKKSTMQSVEFSKNSLKFSLKFFENHINKKNFETSYKMSLAALNAGKAINISKPVSATINASGKKPANPKATTKPAKTLSKV